MNWQVRLHDCIASECLSGIIETLSELFSIHVPLKCYKNKYVSKFHREKNLDAEQNKTYKKNHFCLSLSNQN